RERTAGDRRYRRHAAATRRQARASAAHRGGNRAAHCPMNTPDNGPKNGDFVAYIEELERRQVKPHSVLSPTVDGGSTQAKTGASAGNPPSVEAITAAMKAAPIGLIAIGLVLVIIGAAFQGGIFLILIGAVVLWQALRSVLRNLQAGDKSQAAQQVAKVL